jgi:NAD(P)-dependent dehydrogenase (short-subunit alcohol dehydrogenase family)
MKQKTWFVTGASKGLGLTLVKKLLQSGHKVAATSRSIAELEKAVGAGKDIFLPLSMNLTDEVDVASSIKAAVDHFGSIDVVVNNAGYGLVGALEELTDAETRQNFEINVYGSLNVIRNVLPFMRQQQSGHIFNISSIGGFTGSFPGFGIYCATKFAMQGFSESLATEVKPFGIQVTIVSPGYFRTDFLSASSLSVPENPMDIYSNVREIQVMHQQAINGNQMGDPGKAALVMIEVAEMTEAPVHLFLGQDAYDLADQKIKAVQKDMAQVKDIAVATGFDQ